MILSGYRNIYIYLHPYREADPAIYYMHLKVGLLHTIQVNIYEKIKCCKDYKYIYII